MSSRLVQFIRFVFHIPDSTQNTNSEVSKAYVKALRNVVDHGVRRRALLCFITGHVTTIFKQVKMVYVASLNDQVVPLYSGLFTAASHPLILRALYIDGDAYQYVSDSAKKKTYRA